MFETVEKLPDDPILKLSQLCRDDPRPEKIDVGVGIFQDTTGETPVMRAVKAAEQRIWQRQTTKKYVGVNGLEAFNQHMTALILGDKHDANRTRANQAVAGTGALRIVAEVLRTLAPSKRFWTPDPTWGNHHAIFGACGFGVNSYPYYDREKSIVNTAAFFAALEKMDENDIVLLHGCCHNPTGIDPTPEQWETLAKLSAEKGWLPLFDFAYQGFGNGLEEDAYGLRVFLKHNTELLIASSYSKNFGMYNERVGAFTLVAEDEATAARAHSQVKTIIRTLYSNPASHGANTIALVLKNDDLKAQWIAELDEMRGRIKAMRQKFVELLKAKGATQDFDFIIEQNGMFSFSGLTPEQVDRLKNEFAIYAVRSGRINVAGITDDNIDYLCESIVKVL